MNNKKSNNYLNYYNQLNNTNELYKINELKTNLTDTSLNLKDNYFTKYFEINIKIFELSVIQFIKIRYLQYDFNKDFLKSYNSKSKFNSPLPKRWRDYFASKNLNINKFKSSLKWIIICIKFYFKSYRTIFITLYDSLKNIFYKGNLDLNNCIFINNLNKEIINSKDLSASAINWLNKRHLLNSTKCYQNSININDFKFDKLNIIYRKNSLPYLNNLNDLLNFIKWIFKSHFYLFCNHNLINFLFYSEFIEAYLHKNLISKNSIFLFNNSNSLYRPLWTYIAENKNSKIIFYFYSSNNEPIINKKNLPSTNWYPLTWNNYLIAHEQQLNFINSVTKVKFKYQIANLFDHSIKTNLDLPDNYVLIFDVTPRNDFEFSFMGEMYDYYSFNKMKTYLNDIVNVSVKYNVNLVIKTKKTNQIDNKEYNIFIKKISSLSNIYICSTNLTLENLIKKFYAGYILSF